MSSGTPSWSESDPSAAARDEAKTTARAAEEAKAIMAARVKTMEKVPTARWGRACIRQLFYGFRSPGGTFGTTREETRIRGTETHRPRLSLVPSLPPLPLRDSFL